MEGVTILSTATVTLGLSWGAVVLLALASFVIYYLVDPLGEKEFNGWRIGTAFGMAIISFCILAVVCVDTTKVTEYKVTIDDSVQYVEFTEKYEVIDQEGKIYTVRERMRSGD